MQNKNNTCTHHDPTPQLIKVLSWLRFGSTLSNNIFRLDFIYVAPNWGLIGSHYWWLLTFSMKLFNHSWNLLERFRTRRDTISQQSGQIMVENWRTKVSRNIAMEMDWDIIFLQPILLNRIESLKERIYLYKILIDMARVEVWTTIKVRLMMLLLCL